MSQDQNPNRNPHPHSVTIEEFNELLRQWNGKQVKIIKHEMSDLDKALINLHGVSYERNYQNIDGYESGNSLHLNGEGMIETTKNNYESLPSNSFEIPLENDAFYEFNGTRFILSTSRGVYTLELVED